MFLPNPFRRCDISVTRTRAWRALCFASVIVLIINPQKTGIPKSQLLLVTAPTAALKEVKVPLLFTTVFVKQTVKLTNFVSVTVKDRYGGKTVLKFFHRKAWKSIALIHFHLICKQLRHVVWKRSRSGLYLFWLQQVKYVNVIIYFTYFFWCKPNSIQSKETYNAMNVRLSTCFFSLFYRIPLNRIMLFFFF